MFLTGETLPPLPNHHQVTSILSFKLCVKAKGSRTTVFCAQRNCGLRLRGPNFDSETTARTGNLDVLPELRVDFGRKVSGLMKMGNMRVYMCIHTLLLSVML
ncbi:hypothetical protein AAY473_010930 [Plecturocebus cupreus]